MQQQPETGSRTLYVLILAVLIVVVLAWGFRAVEGYQTGSATATARMGSMLSNQTQFYATQTAEND